MLPPFADISGLLCTFNIKDRTKAIPDLLIKRVSDLTKAAALPLPLLYDNCLTFQPPPSGEKFVNGCFLLDLKLWPSRAVRNYLLGVERRIIEVIKKSRK